MKDNDSGRRASAEPALVADATGAASVSAHTGDGQAQEGEFCRPRDYSLVHPCLCISCEEGRLPDVESEGERLAAETWRHPSGMYLWTDLVGAIQTAIAEERARHVR